MEPSLAVILISPDRYDTIRKTVAHLRKQTIIGRIELVLVFPDAGAFQPDPEDLAGFHSCVKVQKSLSAVGAAYAAGIRNAVAPVVALGEDHSYPQPGWAEALVNAHRQHWAAVGPAIANANPHSTVSVADLLCAYGPWLHPAVGGVQHHLPGHNSSYKRDILLDYGERLEEMMEAESVLHWDLIRNGHELYLEPAAVTAHTNFELWSSWIPVQYHSGRSFAASRSGNEHWPALRRLLFAASWPLIPPVRLARILRTLLQRNGDLASYLYALPALLVGLFISAAGEAAGYLFGSGISLQRLIYYEFHRDAHRRTAKSSS